MRASTQYCGASDCAHPGDIGVEAALPLITLIDMPWSSVAPAWADCKSVCASDCCGTSGPPATIPFHTWNNEDSPSLYAPRNLLSQYFDAKHGKAAWSTDCAVTTDGPEFNDRQVASFEHTVSKNCTVTMRQGMPLQSSAARGKPIYVFLQARLSASASVALWIDPGVAANGTSAGQRSSALLTGENAEVTEDGWQALTFHGVLGVRGVASFGFTVTGGEVAVAGVVAAAIGQEWSQFLAG